MDVAAACYSNCTRWLPLFMVTATLFFGISERSFRSNFEHERVGSPIADIACFKSVLASECIGVVHNGNKTVHPSFLNHLTSYPLLNREWQAGWGTIRRRYGEKITAEKPLPSHAYAFLNNLNLAMDANVIGWSTSKVSDF